MKKKWLIVILSIIWFNLSAQAGKLSYFERIGLNAFNDLTDTFTAAPGIYKNMFAVPFSKAELKNTGIQIGFLATSFFFDESFNELSKNEIEPHCNKYVRHIRLPLPILSLKYNKSEKYWFEFGAPNSFHYDWVFLTFSQYGYLAGLITENETLRNLSHDLMQATIYSFVFAQPLKPLIGRGRPIRDHDDWDDIGPWVWGRSSFKTAGQYTAFPSFHATFYSSYCTVLMDYLGARWAGPLLGAFFFFQQPGHVHWLSDIVGAHILGYWLASSILDTPLKSETPASMSTKLLISPQRGGIALNLNINF